MAPAPVARRDRLSYELRTTSHETKHRFGINALAVDYYNSLLYTAGRDATVRVWDISSTVEQTEYVDEDKARTDIKYLRSSNSHTDWVNDMFLTEDGCTVVTCSSDKTVRVIDTERMLSEASLTAHTDYVKCLAYSATANRFASAGLDGSVHLWNLDTISSASKSIATMPSQYEASIYALDIDESSNHVASGGTDRVVKLWDTRSQQRTCLLKGHGDNIKVIKMLTDRMILSGASDGSVRLWDTRQQRCLHTYYIHNEGIWCMEVSDSYDKMWTSGKDCKVMETSLLDFESTFLFEERAPVHALARGGIDSNVLWAGTTHSDVNGWRCLDPKTRSSYNADMRFSDEKSALKPRPSLFGDMPSISHVNNPEDDAYLEEEMPPCLLVPTFLIEGTAGIVKYEVLNSKCRMLSLDDRGHVMLWNILTASLIKDYGEIEFEESIKSHFELEFVSNWFQCDHNTGTLTIHLDYPSCFNAEAYRDSFEDCKDSVTATEKVNLGYLVIKRLCSKWEPHGRPSNGEQSSVQVMGSVPRPLPNAYGGWVNGRHVQSTAHSQAHRETDTQMNTGLQTHNLPHSHMHTHTHTKNHMPTHMLTHTQSQLHTHTSTEHEYNGVCLRSHSHEGSQFSAKGMKEGHKVDGAPLNQPLERTHMCPPMATQTQTQPQTLPESQLGIARSQNFSYSSTNTNTYTHNHGQPLHKDFFDERGSCVSEKEKQSEHEGEQRSVGVVGVREGEYGNVHVSQATSSSASLGMSDGECIGEIAGSVEGNSENKKVRVCERDEHVGVCKRNKNERGVPLSPLLNLDGRSKASQRLTTLPQTLPGLSVHDTDTHTQENTRTHTETHTHTAADTIRAPCANNGHVMSESVDMSESGHERSGVNVWTAGESTQIYENSAIHNIRNTRTNLESVGKKIDYSIHPGTHTYEHANGLSDTHTHVDSNADTHKHRETGRGVYDPTSAIPCRNKCAHATTQSSTCTYTDTSTGKNILAHAPASTPAPNNPRTCTYTSAPVSAATSSHTHVNGYSDTKSNLDTESELYFSMPDFTPIRVTELAPNSGFVHVQMLCGDFDKSSGCDAMKIHAPRFVRSCVFEDQKPQLRDIPKITFFVDPTSSPGHRREGVPIILPVMPQGNRLSANRALRVMRILRYIIEKIGPAIRSLCQLSITQAEMEKKPHEYLELFCMGKPLEPRTTLGAIKYHLWTNGEDITLQYRLK